MIERPPLPFDDPRFDELRDGEREGGVDGFGASLRPEERHRMRFVGPGSPSDAA